MAIIGILAAIARTLFECAGARAGGAGGVGYPGVGKRGHDVHAGYLQASHRLRRSRRGGLLGRTRYGSPSNGAPSEITGVPEFSFAPNFMAYSQLRILTTPISYITTTAMNDVFCSRCAITYNTRYSGSSTQPESYTFSWSGGSQDRRLGILLPAGRKSQRPAVRHSNGLSSRGDIFVSNVFSDIVPTVPAADGSDFDRLISIPLWRY